MLTDYKFVYIKRLDDGSTGAKVRFYGGDITTEPEDVDDVMTPVTRYRRAAALRTVDFSWPTHIPDEAVRGLMNAELAKDRSRSPIEEQRVRAQPRG